MKAGRRQAVTRPSPGRSRPVQPVTGASLTQINDTVYTRVVTPTPNLQGAVELTVQAGAFTSTTGVASTQDDAVGVFYATP